MTKMYLLPLPLHINSIWGVASILVSIIKLIPYTIQSVIIETWEIYVSIKNIHFKCYGNSINVYM